VRLTKGQILNDYDYFKNKAILYCQDGDIDKSAKFTEMVAKIGYKFNFKYSDEELEDNIHRLAEKIPLSNIKYVGIKNKIVFYDSFAIDNRGLTQQYLRAIFEWNCELLFITNQKKIGDDILKELSEYQKSTIYIANGKSLSENIKQTAETIALFRPEKVLLHYSPWDIFGFTLWSKIKLSERFFINLTDHAYWLGKNTADYFLEFRKYGCYLSLNYRNIPTRKLLIQYYYPILTEKKFEGFPIEKDNKIFAFSGSNYNKIYGKNFIFLKIIKEALDKNDDLVFLFAGNGNSKPLLKFIKKNKIEDRFILIGNRNDLTEVFKHIDIYINTYPMIGGLMSQYAVINNKPIIGYTDPINYCFNDTEDFLGIEKKGLIVKSTIKDFIEYFNILIKSKKAKKENIDYTRNAVISETDFAKTLRNNLMYKQSRINLNDLNISINTEDVFEKYYDIEVNFSKEYYYLIHETLREDLFKCNLNIILRTIFGMARRIKALISIIYKIFFHK
jgi:hypothetical protein